MQLRDLCSRHTNQAKSWVEILRKNQRWVATPVKTHFARFEFEITKGNYSTLNIQTVAFSLLTMGPVPNDLRHKRA